MEAGGAPVNFGANHSQNVIMHMKFLTPLVEVTGLASGLSITSHFLCKVLLKTLLTICCYDQPVQQQEIISPEAPVNLGTKISIRAMFADFTLSIPPG